jgi:hypothetical protein
MRREPSAYRSKSFALHGICGVLGMAGAGFSCLWVGVSCSAKTVIVDVPIEVYVPASCGDAGGAQVTYTGLGDFPQLSPATETVALGSSGLTLTALPPATRQVVLAAVMGAGGWAGSALVPAAGPVEMLTLPMDHACSLSRAVNLAGDPGTVIGMTDATHAMLIGGPFPPFIIDLGNGSIAQLEAALMPARDYSTITPFGAGALVAGGEDPMAGEQSTAVVYTPGPNGAPGTFGTPIDFPDGQTREKHAAVALADGRVLLVGGVSGSGELITAIDVLDPATPTNVTVLPAPLHTPRTSPTVLALPNGEVFIGGGFDAEGAPVTSVEWLAADLSWMTSLTLCNKADTEQGFAATEGGAVLAVMGPIAGTPSCSNVHLVLPSGIEDAPVLTPAPSKIRLFQGAEASPVLITDSAGFRWSPWSGAFTSLGPTAKGPSFPTSAFIAASSGLALWLGGDNNLWTLRFDTHGEYATDVAHGPYLQEDDMFTAPDRLPPSDVSFMPQKGGAKLSNGATIWLTDATFAEVTASVVLPKGGAANVVLRDPSGNEVICAATGVATEGVVQVVRSGAAVQVSVGASAPTSCVGALDSNVRVSIGVRGPASGQGTSTVKSLSVTR